MITNLTSGTLMWLDVFHNVPQLENVLFHLTQLFWESIILIYPCFQVEGLIWGGLVTCPISCIAEEGKVRPPGPESCTPLTALHDLPVLPWLLGESSQQVKAVGWQLGNPKWNPLGSCPASLWPWESHLIFYFISPSAKWIE